MAPAALPLDAVGSCPERGCEVEILLRPLPGRECCWELAPEGLLVPELYMLACSGGVFICGGGGGWC
jgi:hypothetical protein